MQHTGAMRTAEQRKASQRRWYDKVHADPVLLARQNQATREWRRRSPQNASVDRLLPDGGYTRANVRVISQEANLIKRRCTDPVVFQRMAIWLERELAAAQRRGDESRRAA